MKKATGPPNTIVFISGAFIGNNCWEEWRRYFEAREFPTLAPAWPFKDAPPEELRNRDAHTDLAAIRLADLVDHFDAFIQALPVQPILIGHSVGGIIVQLLLQRGLGSAGVAMHSIPPGQAGGVSFSFIREWWEAMDRCSAEKKTYLVSFRKWKNDFTNGMSSEKQKQLYYKYAVPESKLVISDLLTRAARIDYRYPHAPLLLTAGSQDRLSTPAQNWRKFKRYLTGGSITDYKEFAGVNHLLFGDARWTEVADYIHAWLVGM